MLTKIKINRLNVISFIIWLLLIVFVLVFNGMLPIKSSIIVISFLVFNLVISFFPVHLKYSLPMIIYRFTGLIRYVVIPYVMVQQNIALSYLGEVKLLMILELMALLIGTFIYYKKNENKNNVNENSLKDDNTSKVSLGLPSLIIMFIGIVLVIYNRSFIERYIAFGSAKGSSFDIYGGAAMLISCFILLFYIGCLKFLKNKISIPVIFKIIISLLIGIIFIKGSSISGDSVSRWSMLITGFITYVYLKKLYPKYEKKLFLFFIITFIFTVTLASTMKFSWNDNYKTLDGIIKEEFDFKTLNAYFAGPKNMYVAMQLNEDLGNSIVLKLKIFFSDTFGNLPLLNTLLSNKDYQSNTLFNYKYYSSYLAVDQIIPYSCQLYNVFGLLFLILEIIQVYLSYYIFFISKKENNFLNIYCCIYLSFVLSLVNCVNYSIVMQTLWIHVLPVFIIYKLNNKTIVN